MYHPVLRGDGQEYVLTISSFLTAPINVFDSAEE